METQAAQLVKEMNIYNSDKDLTEVRTRCFRRKEGRLCIHVWTDPCTQHRAL